MNAPVQPYIEAPGADASAGAPVMILAGGTPPVAQPPLPTPTRNGPRPRRIEPVLAGSAVATLRKGA